MCGLGSIKICCLDMQRWDKKAKVQMARDVKKKKVFYRYTDQKRWTSE